MELEEMLDGWRWRYSRQLELAAMVASIIGNRIPLNEEAVDPKALCQAWPHFVAADS